MGEGREVVVEVKNVSKYYGRGFQALSNVSLTARKGERVVIVGPNGSGKTTLIKLIMGLSRPSSGYIEVFGARVGSRRYDSMRRRIGYMPEKTTLPLEVKVEDYLCVVSSIRGCSDYSEVTQALGLHRVYNRRISALSQGYKRRLLLAAALTCNPELLVLDEPYANVDIESKIVIDEILNTLPYDVTVLVASHIRPSLERFRLLLMVSGQIVSELTYEGEYAELTLTCNSGTYKLKVAQSKSDYRDTITKINSLIDSECRIQDISVVTFEKLLYEALKKHRSNLATLP